MLKDSYASKHKVRRIQKVEANTKIDKSSSESFKRTQFSLTFAWACNVHRVNGLTSS